MKILTTGRDTVVWLLPNIVYSEMWFSIFTTKRKMKHVLMVSVFNPCLSLNIQQNSKCLISTHARLFKIGQTNLCQTGLVSPTLIKIFIPQKNT